MLEDASWQKAGDKQATTYVVEECQKNAPGIPVIPSLNHRALRLTQHAYTATSCEGYMLSEAHRALRDKRV